MDGGGGGDTAAAATTAAAFRSFSIDFGLLIQVTEGDNVYNQTVDRIL